MMGRAHADSPCPTMEIAAFERCRIQIWFSAAEFHFSDAQSDLFEPIRKVYTSR